MKDFLVGIGAGLLGQTAFAPGVGSSIRRIGQLERRSGFPARAGVVQRVQKEKAGATTRMAPASRERISLIF